MKISKFANKYEVSNDTIRYYMDLNLITPQKKGGHYYFDNKCKMQMDEILKLKEMNFSLNEIKKIINFKRIGKFTRYEENSYYQNIYLNKIKDVNKEILKLKTSKKRLQEEVINLKDISDDKVINIGVDLSVLSLFSCPYCNKELLLSAEKVEENQIIEGELNCKCGQSLEIKEGMLYINNHKNIEHINENYIEEYIKGTSSDFIDQSYNSLEWLKDQLDFEELSGKVIMEPGSGYGYFIRQIYDKLSE